MAVFKERLQGDWNAVIKALDILQKAEHAHINYQDFVCQLYLRDVFVMDSMKPTKDILKVLEDTNVNKLWTPILRCYSQAQTYHGETHDVYSSIRPIFGYIVVSTVAGESSISINEDLRGWDGDSDLILSSTLKSQPV
ncbi:hypothetical protein CVT25_001732 [Psilocybe cyanescens]|uniref:Uncharacterized protein n=1 Tax=Psilocybe cyanescens TaxID=93625 RepID=A0A409WPJ2_PSICY|nr:hypothetical protein CVT25_001732 [Psilocybe cyanescens]